MVSPPASFAATVIGSYTILPASDFATAADTSVEDSSDMRAMLDLGVDGKLTNRSDILKDILKDKGEKNS